jgi:hypothetical protein
MKEIFLKCDSQCISCPKYGRIIRITDYQDIKKHEIYYCPYCKHYILCRRGIAFRRDKKGKMVPICSNCQRYLEQVELSYSEGGDIKITQIKNIIFIRKPNGTGFTILKAIKAEFFRDLAEIFLYVLFNEGTGDYNLISYNKELGKCRLLYEGFITGDNIIFKAIV